MTLLWDSTVLPIAVYCGQLLGVSAARTSSPELSAQSISPTSSSLLACSRSMEGIGSTGPRVREQSQSALPIKADGAPFIEIAARTNTNPGKSTHP
jgi:hypothetical protein